MHINSSQRFLGLRPVVRNTALSLLVLGVSACSDDEKPRDATETNLEQQARGVLDAHHAEGKFPGAVMALHDPKRGATLVTTGTITPDTDAAPVDPDVPWGIGSASRPMKSEPLSSFAANPRPASYGVSSGVMSLDQTR